MRLLTVIPLVFMFAGFWFGPSVMASHPEGNDTVHSQQPTFRGWLAAFRKEAKVKGISQKTIDEALTDVKPLARVIELDRHQPEFKLTFPEYHARVVNEARIRKGRSLLKKYPTMLGKIEARYGVPRQYLVALWGMETDFGRLTGGFSVIEALVTLAYDGRRGAFFREELINALKIIDQGHVTAKRMTGSWAGAMGQTQFMPSTFLRYAVDFTRDGQKDVWRSKADALASGANYLSSVGWNRNIGWGLEVTLPQGFDTSIAGLEVERSLAAWRLLGLNLLAGQEWPDANETASLIVHDGEPRRSFLVFSNYRTIMDWNRSHSFATSVGLLADALAR